MANTTLRVRLELEVEMEHQGPDNQSDKTAVKIAEMIIDDLREVVDAFIESALDEDSGSGGKSIVDQFGHFRARIDLADPWRV